MTGIPISHAQLDALEESVQTSFVLRACTFLRDVAAQDTKHMTERDMQSFVAESSDLARSYGAVGEKAIMQWICLRVMAGLDFFKMPEVEGFLNDGRDFDRKLQQIYDRLSVLETRRR